MAGQIINIDLASDLGRATAAFVVEAQKQFAKYEGSSDRVITLKETYDSLNALSQSQADLFKQTLRAIEVGLFRASMVLAWAAFMDVLQEKLASDGWKKAVSVSPKFPSGKQIDEIREILTDYSFIGLGKDCGLYTKGTMKSLHGSLAERNLYAHPGASDPSMNEALGYVSKLLKRVIEIQAKSI